MAKNRAISKLRKLQKMWGKAEPKTFGRQLPDDEYVVKIKNAVVEEAKSSGRLQVTWTLRVLEGKFKGKEITHRSGLETEDNLSYFQGELETLELDIPEDLEEIGDVLQEAIGLELTASLSTRGDFQNVRFGELLEATEKVRKPKKEEEEDEDEEEDEEEEEEEEERPVKKGKKSKSKKEDEDEDEGNEEDEYRFPTKAEVLKMDQDVLLEMIDEYELDIDKPKKLSLKELRKAVIEASVFEEDLDESDGKKESEDEEESEDD